MGSVNDFINLVQLPFKVCVQICQGISRIFSIHIADIASLLAASLF